MSWGALPWWVYQVEYEQYLCQCSCAFPEEYWAGFTQSTPQYVIHIRKQRENEDD